MSDIFNEDMCCKFDNGVQCDTPPSITVKHPCPPPYEHIMMSLRLCARHYDELFPNGEENLWV